MNILPPASLAVVALFVVIFASERITGVVGGRGRGAGHLLELGSGRRGRGAGRLPELGSGRLLLCGGYSRTARQALCSCLAWCESQKAAIAHLGWRVSGPSPLSGHRRAHPRTAAGRLGTIRKASGGGWVPRLLGVELSCFGSWWKVLCGGGGGVSVRW